MWGTAWQNLCVPRSKIESGLWGRTAYAALGKLLSITSSGSEYYDGMYREADGVAEVRKAAREQLKARSGPHQGHWRRAPVLV